MEIKVLETVKLLENAGLKTYIFEGVNIVHEYIEYRDISHLRALVKSRTNYNNLMEIGFPHQWWDEDYNENNPGSFLLIQYDISHETEVKFLILKNCKVFITNKGITVDYICVY